ncbi:MAG: helix-turn-helix domain-containing protein [Bacteroidales bacterium]|jgi:excisionase family DNA binding protein|nr:helix-turn-helix domain-containing protein [Bacteroidales bacterium]
MENKKLTVSIQEAAELLGISRNLGYSLARQGKLPGVLEIGQKRLVVSRFLLEKFLEGKTDGQ